MKKYIIEEKRLKELLDSEEELLRLKCAGVDNWDGYSYAFSEDFDDMFKEVDNIFADFEEYKK